MFVEIGGIVNEGEGAGLVNEAELGDEAHGAADGGSERIEGGVRGGKGAVDAVGEVPVAGFVVAPFPGDAVLEAEAGVGFFHTPALHATELFDGNTMDGGLGKALEEHPAGDLVLGTLVCPGGGVDAGHGVVVIRRDAEGVEAQAVLAEPEEGAIALGGGLDGGVGDGGAGAEDEGGDGGDGEAGDQTVGADPFDGGVIDFDAAFFEVDGRPAVLGGSEGVEWGAFEDGHGESAGGGVGSER